MTVSASSPVSQYLKTHHCGMCGAIAIGCGDTSCDGYLVPEEAGHPGVARCSCVTCSWSGTGPRLPSTMRVITTKSPARS